MAKTAKTGICVVCGGVVHRKPGHELYKTCSPACRDKTRSAASKQAYANRKTKELGTYEVKVPGRDWKHPNTTEILSQWAWVIKNVLHSHNPPEPVKHLTREEIERIEHQITPPDKIPAKRYINRGLYA